MEYTSTYTKLAEDCIAQSNDQTEDDANKSAALKEAHVYAMLAVASGVDNIFSLLDRKFSNVGL